MRRLRAILCVLTVTASAACAEGSSSGVSVYDLTGRELGRLQIEGVTGPRIQPLRTQPFTQLDGSQSSLPSGIYLVCPSGLFPSPASPHPAGSFGFIDVSAAYLPPEPWGALDIDTADVTGDGRTDIVFSRGVRCDSLADTQPRLWVQTPAGTFVDETNLRLPVLAAPAWDLELFDCDGDGDTDLFLGGYQCSAASNLAVLLINNGSGVFTDESTVRLPQAPPGDFVYFAAHARLDANDSQDLAVMLFRTQTDTATHQWVVPRLWLNSGQGVYTEADSTRIPIGDYGYFDVLALDIDNDSLQDLVCANLSILITGPGGPDPIDTLPGQLACYRNTGNGIFLDETRTRMPLVDTTSTRAFASADVDRDGDTDLLDIRFLGDLPQVRLLRNTGTGVFAASDSSIPSGVTGWFNDGVFGLLDDDGFPDLFLTKVMPGIEDRDVLLLNNAGVGFVDSSGLLPDVVDFSVAAALCDHQIDDDPDILTANIGTTTGTQAVTRLYHNTRNDPVSVDGRELHPLRFDLATNYPNPFNPSTRIRFSLSSASEVELTVYDLLGRGIARLVAGRYSAGDHEVSFDAAGLPSGVYWYRIRAGGFVQVRRMILAK